MHKSTRLIISIIAGSLGLCAYGQDLPTGVSIESIDYAGSACKQGSVGSYVSDDGSVLTLLFDNFTVSTDASPNGRDQKACNLKMNLDVPPGWSLGLFCLDYQGYASLDAGVKSSQISRYTVDGGKQGGFDRYDLSGPIDDNFEHRQLVDLDKLVWTPCSKSEATTLNIETTASIQAQPPTYQKKIGYRSAIDIRTNLARISSRIRKYAKPLSKDVRTNMANFLDLSKAFIRNEKVEQVQSKFQNADSQLSTLIDSIETNAPLSGDAKVKKYLPTILSQLKVLRDMLTPQGAEGFLTVDSIDGHLKHHYAIAWKRCNEVPRQCDSVSGYKIPPEEFDNLDGSAGAFLRGRNNATIDWSKCQKQYTDASVDNGGIRINFANAQQNEPLTLIVNTKKARLYRVAHAKNISGRNLPRRFESNKTYTYSCKLSGDNYNCDVTVQ